MPYDARENFKIVKNGYFVYLIEYKFAVLIKCEEEVRSDNIFSNILYTEHEVRICSTASGLLH